VAKTLVLLAMTAYAISQVILVQQYEVQTDRLEAALDKCAGIKKE